MAYYPPRAMGGGGGVVAGGPAFTLPPPGVGVAGGGGSAINAPAVPFPRPAAYGMPVPGVAAVPGAPFPGPGAGAAAVPAPRPSVSGAPPLPVGGVGVPTPTPLPARGPPVPAPAMPAVPGSFPGGGMAPVPRPLGGLPGGVAHPPPPGMPTAIPALPRPVVPAATIPGPAPLPSPAVPRPALSAPIAPVPAMVPGGGTVPRPPIAGFPPASTAPSVAAPMPPFPRGPVAAMPAPGPSTATIPLPVAAGMAAGGGAPPAPSAAPRPPIPPPPAGLLATVGARPMPPIPTPAGGLGGGGPPLPTLLNGAIPPPMPPRGGGGGIPPPMGGTPGGGIPPPFPSVAGAPPGRLPVASVPPIPLPSAATSTMPPRPGVPGVPRPSMPLAPGASMPAPSMTGGPPAHPAFPSAFGEGGGHHPGPVPPPAVGPMAYARPPGTSPFGTAPGGGGGGGGMAGMPPPGGMGVGGMAGMASPHAPMAVIPEAYQVKPAYLAFTMGAMPHTKELVDRSRLPFGMCVHPMAEGDGSLGRGGIPVVNFGPAGVIRCKKCRAYVNPFAKFIDDGKRWRCNLCAFVNDVPPPYYAPLDGEGNRVDVASRPELCSGSVEFVAPTEYMVRPPQAPVYVFVLDVSYQAVASGLLSTAAAAIAAMLDRLPGDDRTQVGFVTFDTAVHYYSLKPSLRAAQMMVVPDIGDLFVPVPEELLVNLVDSKHLVTKLLAQLPTMFASTRVMDTTLGSALEAAYAIMQHIGGKMVVVQSMLPSVGAGRLKVREGPKMLGTDKEFTLLAPDAGDDGGFYKAKAVDFSRQQICVDMFLTSPNYMDVATLGALARYTAGQVYTYPGFGPVEAERFHRDFCRNLIRTTGFEAVMRLRASNGLTVTNFYGNFFIRGSDLLALPNVTCDTAFNVDLAHGEGVLQPGSVVTVQAALLYTTAAGERRICVHTLAKPVTTMLADLFRGVDSDTVCNMMAKVALDHALRTGLPAARRFLFKAVADVVRAWRAVQSGGGSGGGMLPTHAGTRSTLPSMQAQAATLAAAAAAATDITTMLPDNLMLLPLYSMGLQKSTLFRGGEHIRSDERAALVYRMLTMPVVTSKSYIYPRLFALHDLAEPAGRPDPAATLPASGTASEMPVCLPPALNLTAERLATDGVFLLDNGVEMYLWIGRAVSPTLLSALFRTPSLDGVDLSSLTLADVGNDYSARVAAIVRTLQEPHAQAQRLRVTREGSGDMNEARFHWHLIEDKQAFPGGTITYAEYLPLINREAQTPHLGGTSSG